jgi:hypothetical protein
MKILQSLKRDTNWASGIQVCNVYVIKLVVFPTRAVMGETNPILSHSVPHNRSSITLYL